jgi:hypothetical protein
MAGEIFAHLRTPSARIATNGREGRNQAAPSSVENLVDPGRDSSAGAAHSRARQAKLLLAIISNFRRSNGAFHTALDHGNCKPIARVPFSQRDSL